MNRRQLLLGATALAAQSKIRVGILGIQHSHLSGKLQAMGPGSAFELVSVCEPDPAVRAAKGQQPLLNGLRWTTVDEMLADKSLDLIVFEGVVKDAIPLGKRILEAGKHLHLEKPPGNTLAPFRDLVETARRRQRLLQLGYLYRYHAGVDAALEAYQKGWLGELQMVRGTINSDRDAAQRAVEARYPGGAMFELGGHMIDRMLAFLGRPTKVHHWLRHDTKSPDTLKDNTLAVFEFNQGLGLIVSSAKMAGADAHRSFEVIGTDGSIMIQPIEPEPVLRIYLRAAQGPYQKGWQEVRVPRQTRFLRDFEELGKAIQARTPLRYSYDHEILLQETLLRASGEIA
ncbi:MAG: Gfo/Idh/MocA family oxidoreductase [Bryobacteraceae bacterium]|nr:Gfo/Idh/MocA family oxidoreductase [Bryobacteraceae bacterium]